MPRMFETSGGFGIAPDLSGDRENVERANVAPPPVVRNPLETPRAIPEHSGSVNRRVRPLDVPTQGWQKTATNILVPLGLKRLVPKPSTVELQTRRLKRKHCEIWQLMDQIDHLTVAPINRKGGSAKTTFMSHQACILRQNSQATVSFIDGNPGSTSPGRVMAMYGGEDPPEWALAEPPLPGMNRRTATVLELLQALEKGQVSVGRSLLNKVRHNHYGVHTLVAHQRIRQGEDLTAKMVDTVFPPVVDSTQVAFIDTGNESTSPSQLQIAKMSDALAFVAWEGMPASLDDLKPVMDTMRSRGFETKVDNATVVIHGIPPGKSIDDYRHYVGAHTGSVLGIPYDTNLGKNRSVRLDQLHIDTYEAFLDALISILKQKIHPVS